MVMVLKLIKLCWSVFYQNEGSEVKNSEERAPPNAEGQIPNVYRKYPKQPLSHPYKMLLLRNTITASLEIELEREKALFVLHILLFYKVLDWALKMWGGGEQQHWKSNQSPYWSVFVFPFP